MAAVAVFGRGAFGSAVADAMTTAGHDVRLVVSPAPVDGVHDRLTSWATAVGADRAESGSLRSSDIPRVDAIVAAHSHDFIGRATRARAEVAVGFHPSLLPLHRGRDAVRWAIHCGDKVTGGTVYHLTDGVDCGPIARQETMLIRPGWTYRDLWRALFPVGVSMLVSTVDDLAAGRIAYLPQPEECATWEPSWSRAPLYRPELLGIGAAPTVAVRAPGAAW